MFRLLIRPLPAETAHHVGLWAVRRLGWAARALRGTRFFPAVPPEAAVEAGGLRFPAPVGLAAGMDKNAIAVRGMLGLGFGFVEVGTVTPRPQPGNDKPRSWRELDLRALRNRMGFNNDGADAVARRLAKTRARRATRDAVIGVNIGKNKSTPTEDAAADYAAAARALAPYASYLVVNVSSPNTPGLRDLQSVMELRAIVQATLDAAVSDDGAVVPVLVKIAPDLADADVDAIADLVSEMGLAGVVAVNTTIRHDRGPGGLSGPPLTIRAREVVARLRSRLGPGPIIIGVGGVQGVEDARALLDAGATVLQAYTAFVYGGPAWPARVNSALARRQRANGEK